MAIMRAGPSNHCVVRNVPILLYFIAPPIWHGFQDNGIHCRLI